MHVSKKSAACELSHVLTPSISSSLLLKCCDHHPVLQVDKQVAVTQNEIRAVRRVVRQIPVELLWQCSNASNCVWICVVMEELYKHTVCQHSMSFVLNGPTQFS
jgi:hypothetical protein